MNRRSLASASSLCIATVVVLAMGYVPWLQQASAQSRWRGRPEGPRIAVIVDGPSDAAQRVVSLLEQETEPLIRGRFPSFDFPSQATHAGDFTPEQAEALVAQALDDSQIDLVVAVGVLVGQALGRRSSLPKPVFLPYAAPELQGIARNGDRSGIENLAYLTGLIDIERELRRFREVMRRDRAVYVFDRYLYQAVGDDGVQRVLDAAGDFQVEMLPVEPTAEGVLAALPEDAEAVFLGPLIRLPDAEIEPLLRGLIARRLPSYASEGRTWVEQGAFTTLTPATEEGRRMRRVALDIQAIAVEGRSVSSLSTVFEPRAELVINMATARAIGVWPRFELMTEATLIRDRDRQVQESMSLQRAVELALEANRGLNATREDVSIAEAQADQAVGGFLPTVSTTGDFTWLDPDVTSALGNAERQLSFGLQARQLLFSAQALAGIDATDANRSRAGFGVRAAELDVVAGAAQAYLGLLRARTAEQVNVENLARIRRNLNLAEIRVEIGSAGRAEVFRWQIEIADGRVSVISASAARNQAEIALNQVLNRPLEAHVVIDEPPERDSNVLFDTRVRPFVEDPWSFKVFREFMAEEAVRNSPELQELDAAIVVQQATLRGQRQALFIPDFALTGGVSHVVSRSGSGSEPLDVAIPGIAPRDNLTWQFGVDFTFPIFDGRRYPAISEASHTLSQLELQRDAVVQQVEQRIRSAMHVAGASNAAVRLREEAAHAAEQNLELVVDSYRRGTVNVITLIDAQNQTLSTQLAASNALYNFLIDYIEVERASGRFVFRMSQHARDDFLARLEAFAEERRGRGESEGATP